MKYFVYYKNENKINKYEKNREKRGK